MDGTERSERCAALEGGCEIDCAAAFEALARREHPRLRMLAWRFGLPADELDDAVQEILERAWRGWGRFRGDSAPETWLTRIAVNYLTSWRRHLGRRWRVFPKVSEMPDVAAPAGPSIETVEARERAAACVARLKPKLRAVFVMRYLEEMTCAEVAAVLKISEEAVRGRAHNARRQLRRMLEGQV